jgi:hypothetical protein
MILVSSDGVELRPELPLVHAPPTIIFCSVSVKRLFELDMSIAALALMKLQSKFIHMVGAL